MIGLTGINIESGVSLFTRQGFCMVTATAEDGSELRGQLDPEDVRTMAMHFLSAAEAAEHDAAVFAELEEMGLEDDVKAAFIASLRKHRKEPEG